MISTRKVVRPILWSWRLLLLLLLVGSLDKHAVVWGMTMSSSPSTLSNSRVAVVTGASRGIGRGIALELGAAGYTVYVLGRSSRSHSQSQSDQESSSSKQTTMVSRPVAAGLDLTVESAAEQVTQLGGEGRAIACDLSQDGRVEDALKKVWDEQGRLDVLVCSAYTTPSTTDTDTDTGLRGDFWTQGMAMWDAVNGVGLRQVYAACHAAAPLMIETAANANTSTNANTNTDTNTATNDACSSSPPPLICLVSSFGGKSYTFNVAYGVGKAAIDRLAVDMSYQLKKHGVATTAIYPGLVQTEANLQMVVDGTWDEASGNLDLSQGETPAFSGKAVVQLASLNQEAMMARSGQIEVVAELAKEFDFNDADGNRPPSIRSLQYLLPNFVFPQIEKESSGGKPVPSWIKDNIPDILLPWSVFSSGPPPEMDTR